MPRAKKAADEGTEPVHFKEPDEDPEYDAWFREQVQIGIDEADRGELIPHQEMKRWLAEQKAELLSKIDEQNQSNAPAIGPGDPPRSGLHHRLHFSRQSRRRDRAGPAD